jgi:hypothetical protein
MEGLPPPYGGNYVRTVRCGGGVTGGGGVLRKRRSSAFPIKEDAGYIGYLSDDEGKQTVDEEGKEKGDTLSVVSRRRQELLGSDISFSSCLAILVTVGCLLMLFLFAASPWGVPPPRGVRPPADMRR